MRFKLKRPAAMSTRGRLGFFERKGNKYKRDEPNEKKLRRWGRPGGFIAKLDATPRCERRRPTASTASRRCRRPC